MLINTVCEMLDEVLTKPKEVNEFIAYYLQLIVHTTENGSQENGIDRSESTVVLCLCMSKNSTEFQGTETVNKSEQ